MTGPSDDIMTIDGPAEYVKVFKARKLSEVQT